MEGDKWAGHADRFGGGGGTVGMWRCGALLSGWNRSLKGQRVGHIVNVTESALSFTIMWRSVWT
jgi:hypothetical protein